MMTTQKWTVNSIKQAVRATGSHWFDPSTMRMFGTKVLPAVYQGAGGVYFVTSEWDGFDGKDKGVRACSVRQFTPETSDIDTIGNVSSYRHKADAIAVAISLAKGKGKGRDVDVTVESFRAVSVAEQFLIECRQHGNPKAQGRTCLALVKQAVKHQQLMEDYCNGNEMYDQDGEPIRELAIVRRTINDLAAKVGAKSVVFSGDPRGMTVKLVWSDGATNDWGKDGWIVPQDLDNA